MTAKAATGAVRAEIRRKDLHTIQPALLTQIKEQALPADMTGQITWFVFEDNEEELDVMEVRVSCCHLRFADHTCFRRATRLSPA